VKINLDLTGKTVVITGAGRGIGRAIALRLAAAGANLAINSRSEKPLKELANQLESGGSEVIAVPMDVSDWTQVQSFAETVRSKFGSVDILINNAAIGTDAKAIPESDVDEWTSIITVNILGTYYMCRAFIEHMPTGSKIINFGSGNGHAPAPIRSAYGTSKAAVSIFSEYLAVEVWKRGIDVNEFIPGPVATTMLPMGTHLPNEEAVRAELADTASSEDPSEWIKTPEVAAEHIAYMCSARERGPTGQVYSLLRRPIRA